MTVCKTCGALAGTHKPSCTKTAPAVLGAPPTEELRTWRVQMTSGRMWVGSATSPERALSKAQSANPAETPAEILCPDVAPPAPDPSDAVNHPPHYGGKDDPYEVIKVAEVWGFDKDAYLFNVLKYIARSDKKGATLEDHKKARFYLDRKIKRLEDEQ